MTDDLLDKDAEQDRRRLQAKTQKLDQLAGAEVALSDEVAFKIVMNAEADPARAILILANKGSETLGPDNRLAANSIMTIVFNYPSTSDYAVTQLLRIPGDEPPKKIMELITGMSEDVAERQIKKFEESSSSRKEALIGEIGRYHPALTVQACTALNRIATEMAYYIIHTQVHRAPEHAETVFDLLVETGTDEAAGCISDIYTKNVHRDIQIDSAIAALVKVGSDYAIDLMGRLEQHERSTATGAHKIIAALRNIGSDQAVALIALNGERHSHLRLDAVQVLQNLRGEAVAAQRNDLATFDQPIRSLLDTAFTLKGIEEMDRDERPLYRAAFAAADASSPEKPSYCKLFDRAVRHIEEEEALKSQFVNRKYGFDDRQPG